jgi:hypothetical protein
MAEEADRQAVLERRRALRKAKKVKGKAFKQEKQRARAEKKQEIVAKIRAKRDEALAAKRGGGYGGGGYGGGGYGGGNNADASSCWLCGEAGHQKQDCPNRGAADLDKTCFQCRRRGHTSANCPQAASGGLSGGGGGSSNICFNCGSAEHRLRDCREPRVNGGATYATCFVCNQTGHLSSRCPQSTTGVYPRGGCCKVCKSVEHLARDCPVGNISVDGSSGLKKNTKKTFADDDDEADAGVQDNAQGSSVTFDDTGDALDDLDVKMDGEDDEQDEKKAKKAKKAGMHLFGKRAGSKRVKF